MKVPRDFFDGKNSLNTTSFAFFYRLLDRYMVVWEHAWNLRDSIRSQADLRYPLLDVYIMGSQGVLVIEAQDATGYRRHRHV